MLRMIKLHACVSPQMYIAIQGNSLCLLYTRQLAKLPTILDIFTGIANTTSISIGWEGGGQVRRHKVSGKGYVCTKINQITSISTIVTSTCHTKHLNPWTNSLVSRVVIHSWLFACQGRWDHLKATPALVDVRQVSERSLRKADSLTFSSIKHMCCQSIDVANKWQWKVCL